MSISNLIKKLTVNLGRLIVAVTFIFSGYVKAIDPLGTQYKITDYLQPLGLSGIVPDWMTLTASVALSTVEFSIGIFLLFAIMFRLSHFLAILSAFYLLGVQLIHRRYKNASTGFILSGYIFSLIFLQCHIPIRLACQYNV